jgi:uncharacterized damage-inducible protein DinB
MNLSAIRELFAYNHWVNRHLLATAAHLTPEQFTAPSTHSFSSVLATLVHMLDAEWGWRMVLNGQDTPLMNPDDFPTVQVLQARWIEEEAAWHAYLNTLSDADLTRPAPNSGDPARPRLLWHCLFHVVNHGGQHRSEVAHLLTTCGHSPGDIDFTDFLRLRPLEGDQ